MRTWTCVILGLAAACLGCSYKVLTLWSINSFFVYHPDKNPQSACVVLEETHEEYQEESKFLALYTQASVCKSAAFLQPSILF